MIIACSGCDLISPAKKNMIAKNKDMPTIIGRSFINSSSSDLVILKGINKSLNLQPDLYAYQHGQPIKTESMTMPKIVSLIPYSI